MKGIAQRWRAEPNDRRQDPTTKGIAQQRTAGRVEPNSEPRHLSWFVFVIYLPLPLTDASDAATRTKRHPEAMTKRVERREMDEVEGDETMKSSGGDGRWTR